MGAFAEKSYLPYLRRGKNFTIYISELIFTDSKDMKKNEMYSGHSWLNCNKSVTSCQ